MINKDFFSTFNKLFKKLDLGDIKFLEILKSSQNKVYKITTSDNIYVLKQYSKAAIKNNYQLKKKVKQISVSYILNKNRIKTILPLTFKNKPIFTFKKNYYSIYEYFPHSPLKEDYLTKEHIRALAQTQSQIHKLNITSDLPCRYRKINIDLNNKLKVVSQISDSLYNNIEKNIDIMNSIICQSNNKISNIKKNLCISHNDYKLLNILWYNKKIILLDFDAVGFSNPTCCLCESAFTFSKHKKQIRYDFYEEYIKSYLKDYGPIKEDFKDALYASFNGKLQWLEHMLFEDNIKNYISEIIEMIDELTLYYKNIDKFHEIYLQVINSHS